jgi:hypothetical protein
MSEQQAAKMPKTFLGVHPAWSLGAVLVLAVIAIFQLI